MILRNLLFYLSIALLINRTLTVEIKYVDKKEIPELDYLDETVDPCDNFYKFACGNFHKVHPLPEGQLNIDHFTILQDEIHDLMKKILQSRRHEHEPVALQKAKAAYAACTSVRYTNGAALPQAAVLRELGGWPLIAYANATNGDRFRLEDVGHWVNRYGVQLFFDLQVGANLFNATEMALWISSDNLLNPSNIIGRLDADVADYLPPATSTVDNRRSATDDYVPSPLEKFFRRMAYRMRNVLGTWKAKRTIDEEIVELIDFMIDLRAAGNDFKPNVTLPSVTTVRKLQEWTDYYFADMQIDWLVYLNNAFELSGVTVRDTYKVLITSTAKIYGVLDLLRRTDRRVLQNFVVARLFTYMAPDGDAAMRDAFDDFYGAINNARYPRDQYCLRQVLGYPDYTQFSFALTYEYQRYFYNINNLAKAAELVIDLQDAFDDMIRDSDWIDEATKSMALKKSANMITLLGYPQQSNDAGSLDAYYRNVRVCEWDHFGNAQRLRALKQAVQYAQYGRARNRELWNLSPLEVNAFYARENNRILFPIGIINPVFFNGAISVLDYSRIGSIIGHEITHGYDESGTTYDENGRYVGKWWSESTTAAYKKRIGCFVEQYNGYFIEEIADYVNGEQTLNENLADNGGLKESYKAYRRLMNRDGTVTAVRNYTTDQLFFIGYGTMWCMTETDYYLDQMHKRNNYSPGRYRVIGPLSNMVEFADAFHCPVGSRMNPATKCSLW